MVRHFGANNGRGFMTSDFPSLHPFPPPHFDGEHNTQDASNMIFGVNLVFGRPFFLTP